MQANKPRSPLPTVLTDAEHEAMLEKAFNSRYSKAVQGVANGISESHKKENHIHNAKYVPFSPNEERDFLQRDAIERRKLRLRQVREQEKLYAARLVAKKREIETTSFKVASQMVQVFQLMSPVYFSLNELFSEKMV